MDRVQLLTFGTPSPAGGADGLSSDVGEAYVIMAALGRIFI